MEAKPETWALLYTLCTPSDPISHQPGNNASIEVSNGEGNGNPLQYSCRENSMDRGARQATVPGVAKSGTLLSDFHFISIHVKVSYPFPSSPSLSPCFRPHHFLLELKQQPPNGSPCLHSSIYRLHQQVE